MIMVPTSQSKSYIKFSISYTTYISIYGLSKYESIYNKDINSIEMKKIFYLIKRNKYINIPTRLHLQPCIERNLATKYI